MIYYIEITETRQTQIRLEASREEYATERVKQLLRDGELPLVVV